MDLDVSMVIGLLISGALEFFPVIKAAFAKLDRTKKVLVVLALAVLWIAGVHFGVPGSAELVDLIVGLAETLAGAAAGYIMFANKKDPA